MTQTRNITHVFLASPGDLQDERQAIREVVDEFNEIWADALGYQVELLGWEETLPGYGRPQHLINSDVDRSDLFLGMIWRRWGTPTSTDQRYTSGFQEEFERAVARREEKGCPEISLFFKDLSASDTDDPGPHLQNVLDFRKHIEQDRQLLYRTFSSVQDIVQLARRLISRHVRTLRFEASSTATSLAEATPTQRDAHSTAPQNEQSDKSPLSPEGFLFLESLQSKLRHANALENLCASDIARFRLLSNSISKPGNNEMDLGVHDINILFTSYASGMNFGMRELLSLADLGFHHLPNENVPLWRWYAATSNSQIDVATLCSVAGSTEATRLGALTIINALERDIPTRYLNITRHEILNMWFAGTSDLRRAALNHLSKRGTTADYKLVEREYARGSKETLDAALDCMVSIQHRVGPPKSAQELVLTSQFESMDPDLLSAVTDGFEHLGTSALREGLEHRNPRVRMTTLSTLVQRNSVDFDTARRLCDDSDAVVRREAIAAIEKLGISIEQEEIRNILVQSSTQATYGELTSLAARASDKKGQALFDRYLSDELNGLSDLKLTKRVGISLMSDDAPYFVRAAKFLRKNAKELRADIDDRFGSYFRTRIHRSRSKFASVSGALLEKRFLEREEHIRRTLTRRGLDILCAAESDKDLSRIRKNLLDRYAGVSPADAKYLAKHGNWDDISLLSGSLAYPFYWSIISDYSYNELHDQVAIASIRLSVGRPISELFALPLPEPILTRTIESCSDSRFAMISNDDLLELLNHTSADVRKASSTKAVRAFTKKRIKSTLDEYVAGDGQRYYNVVHWLDLGASMSRKVARRVSLLRFA